MERKPKPKLTTRQEWSKYSNETQLNIDELMDRLMVDVGIANAMLADLYESNPGEAHELACNVEEYLNSQWTHIDDTFFVTGKWHEPTFASSEDMITVSHIYQDACSTAASSGFTTKVVKHNGAEVPRVGLWFVYGEVPAISSTMRAHIQLMAFAQPNEISLQYIRPKHHKVVSSDVREVDSAIKRADKILKLYTDHEASAFYEVSAKRQQAFFEEIINSFNDVLPAPETYDQLELTEGRSSVFYVRNPGSSDLLRIDAEDSEQTFDISGVVGAVTIVAALDGDSSKRLNSPNDLSANDGGLSLIVQPYDPPLELGDYSDEPIIVPIRAMTQRSLKVR